MASLHDTLDRCDRALARIEAALAKRSSADTGAPSPAPADDKLRQTVASVIEELDGLIEASRG